MSSLIKIGLGAITLTVLVWLFPLFDLFCQFLMICLIPLVALVACGLVSEGTYHLIKSGLEFEWYRDLKMKIDMYREEIESKDA